LLPGAPGSVAPHAARTDRLPPMNQLVWPSSRSSVASNATWGRSLTIYG
jgi:hypothetical protein